jgi:hypothetical protein
MVYKLNLKFFLNNRLVIQQKVFLYNKEDRERNLFKGMLIILIVLEFDWTQIHFEGAIYLIFVLLPLLFVVSSVGVVNTVGFSLAM